MTQRVAQWELESEQTAGCDEHGDDGGTGSADHTYGNESDSKEDVAEHGDVEVGGGLVQGAGVVGVEFDKGATHKPHHQGKTCHEDDHLFHRTTMETPNAIWFTGSKVLSSSCFDGDANSKHTHEDEHVHVQAQRVGGCNLCSKTANNGKDHSTIETHRQHLQ